MVYWQGCVELTTRLLHHDNDVKEVVSSQPSITVIQISQSERALAYSYVINAKWNRKFPEFPSFQKTVQPREVNRNFRNEFPENFCSIRFWTGIFGNFGRMERALRFFRKFSNGTKRKIMFHLQPNRNFQNFLVNGKRPGSLLARLWR